MVIIDVIEEEKERLERFLKYRKDDLSEEKKEVAEYKIKLCEVMIKSGKDFLTNEPL